MLKQGLKRGEDLDSFEKSRTEIADYLYSVFVFF